MNRTEIEMITEQEAIERAWILIRREGIKVSEVQSIRKLSASCMPGDLSVGDDIWTVQFALDLPDDEVWSPEAVFIDVNCRTGEAVASEGL